MHPPLFAPVPPADRLLRHTQTVARRCSSAPSAVRGEDACGAGFVCPSLCPVPTAAAKRRGSAPPVPPPLVKRRGVVQKRRMIAAVAAAAHRGGSGMPRAVHAVRAVACGGDTIDLRGDGPLDEGLLLSLQAVVPGLPQVRCLDVSALHGTRVLQEVEGRMLVRLLAHAPSITSVLCTNVLFEVGSQRDMLHQAAASHRTVQHVAEERRHTVARSMAAREADLRIRQKYIELVVGSEAQRALWRVCMIAGTLIEERAQRIRTQYEQRYYLGLLGMRRRQGAEAIVFMETTRLRVQEALRTVMVSEAQQRAAIGDSEAAHALALGNAEVLHRHRAAEKDRVRKKRHRREQFDITHEQLHQRHLLIRAEVEDFKQLLKGQTDALEILRIEELARTKAACEAEIAAKAEQLALEEAVRESEKQVLQAKRRQVQQREAVLREERVESSEMAMHEEHSRVEVYKQWDREYTEACVAEMRGNRRREKIRAERLPPVLHVARCDNKIRYYCTGQPLQRQVFPNAVLRAVQAPLSYHTQDLRDIDPETPEEWSRRKTRIMGGTMSFTLDMGAGSDFREGDSLDLVDSLTFPELTHDAGTISYQGRTIATVKDVGMYDFDTTSDDTRGPESCILGNKVGRVLLSLAPHVTSNHVSMLTRLIGFKRGLFTASSSQARTDHIRVLLSADLQFKVSSQEAMLAQLNPQQDAKGNASGTELAVAHVSASVQVMTMPPRFRCQPAALCVGYSEGDSYCHFGGGVTLRSMQSETWDRYRLRLRYGGVCCPRDAVYLMRRARMKQDEGHAQYLNFALKHLPTSSSLSNSHGPEEEFTVSEKRRLVLLSGRPVATLEGETVLLNADTSNFVSTTQCSIMQFQFTDHMAGPMLTKFLHAFVFRNDSIDPVDGMRIMEATLTDPDGHSETLRIGIDVVSEDTKTTICLNAECMPFRRVAGDVLGMLREEVPKQAPLRLAPAALVTDIDTEEFSSGHLLVTVTKCSPQDTLSFSSADVRMEGTQVFVNDVVVGTTEVLRPRNSVVLHLTFGKNSSITAVQALVRSLSFYTEPPPTPAYAYAFARKAKSPDTEEVCSGTVRAGLRDVELTLIVEQADPVVVKMQVNVFNALIVIPTSLQALVFVERSAAVRLSTKFDLSTDVQFYDTGSLEIELSTGAEPKDFIELQLPENSEFILGPRKALTLERDMIHLSTRTTVGTLFIEDTKITIKFRNEAREGGTSRRLRRKDVLGILKLVSYQHRGDNPRHLQKVVCIRLDDGQGLPSCAYIHISVQPVNDVTQIFRNTTRPAVYRQNSLEDTGGYCPFEDCVLHDADTENFSGGYLAVDVISGQRGMDKLTILPSSLQEGKGYTSLVTQCSSESDQCQPVLYNGTPIGMVQHSINSIIVRFSPDCPATTIDVVQHLMRLVRYTNVSNKIRPSTMVLSCRVAPSEEGPDGNLEGRLRLAVQIAEPLLSVDDAAPDARWRDVPVAIVPTMRISLPDRHKCLGVYITCRVLDSGPGDLLGFVFSKSPFNFRLKGTRDILTNSKAMGRITERSRTRLRVDFASTGECTAKLVKGLMQCISFHNTEVQYVQIRRRIEFVLHLQDSLPGVMVADVTVCEPGRPTELLVRHRVLEVHCTAAVPLLPDCCIVDTYTDVFTKGTFLLVEVLNAQPTDHLELRLPRPGKSANEDADTLTAQFVSLETLCMTSDGWVKDQVSRIGNACGMGSSKLNIAFVNCSHQSLQTLVRFISYSSSAITKRGSDPGVKEILVTIKSHFERCMGHLRLQVEVLPPVLELSRTEMRLDAGVSYVHVLESCVLDIHSSFSSARVSVCIVQNALSQDAVTRKGIELAVHGATTSQGTVTFPGKILHASMSPTSTASAMVLDFPHSEISSIENCMQSIVVRRTGARVKPGVVHLSVSFAARTFTDGSAGPIAAHYQVAVSVK